MSNKIEFNVDVWEFDIEEKSLFNADTENTMYMKIEELFRKIKSHFENSTESFTTCSLYYENIIEIPSLLPSCFVNNTCTNTNGKDNRKVKQENLQAAEYCMKILLTCLERPLTSDTAISITQASFSAIYQAYIHCRDSEEFYGDLFEDFQDDLGNFYNIIQEVQKVSLIKLDEIMSSETDTYQNTADIILICNAVGKLCELVTSLDRMNAPNLWKSCTKIILKYKDLLHDKLDGELFLSPLVSDVKNNIEQCCNCIEMNEQVVEADIKILIFELSTLTKFFEIFKGHLQQAILLQMRDLALELYSLIIQCYSDSINEGKDINVVRIVLKTVKPVIMALLSNSMFFDIVFFCDPKKMSEKLLMPLVLLKLTAINYLKIHSESCELLQKGKALNELFSTLMESKMEDDLTLVSLKIAASLFKELRKDMPEIVSLYQHCYVSLCECSSLISCSSDAIYLLEKEWLHMLLSSSDVVSLLISDVWIYYLRRGDVDNAYKRCMTVSNALISDSSNSRVKQLLIRMLKFLPTEYKIKLFESVDSLCKVLHNYNFSSRFGLQYFVNPLPINQILCEKMKIILTNFNNPCSSDVDKLAERACSILELSIVCAEKFDPAELLKLIKYATILNKDGVYEIQLSIIKFLRTLNGKSLSKNNKEIDALTTSVANLLSDLMYSKNYFIRIEAFNLYFDLAKSTPHTEMLKKTVIKCPSLIPAIKAFAQETPESGFLDEKQRSVILRKQLLNNCTKLNASYTFSDEMKQILLSLFT